MTEREQKTDRDTTFHTSYDELRRRAVGFVATAVEEAGAEGVVVGVSGGIDSTVAAHIAVRAVGSENVQAYSFPAAANRYENMRDAEEVADKLDVGFRSVEIQGLVDRFADTAEVTTGRTLEEEERRLMEGNAAARLRMALLYSQASIHDSLVVGTGNRSELLLGYYTKHGDGAADILPIGDLYKTEVRGLARHLGVPDKIVGKPPTAGLWGGQSDESELGLPYEEIDRVLNLYVDRQLPMEDVADEAGVDVEELEDVVEMLEENEHKRTPPPTPLTYGVSRRTRVESANSTDGGDGSLDERQLRHVMGVLADPPAEEGYDARRWTPELVVDYVERSFEIAYSEERVRRLLEGLGYDTTAGFDGG